MIFFKLDGSQVKHSAVLHRGSELWPMTDCGRDLTYEMVAGAYPDLRLCKRCAEELRAALLEMRRELKQIELVIDTCELALDTCEMGDGG